MYINLYPHKQLRKTRLFFVRAGLFFIFGGSYALLNEAWLQDQSRLNWSLAAVALIIAGIISLCVGLDKIRLKDAYFSMNPDRIRFRLSVYGKEQELLWDDVASVQIDQHKVVFLKKSGEQQKIRTGAIQSAELAHHVQTSIRLAAMEKRITVNQVPMGEFVTSASS